MGFFDANRDTILLTVSLPGWARSEKAIEWLGQFFCWLVVSIRLVRNPEDVTLAFFAVENIVLHPKGTKVLCVYIKGDEPALPEPGELDLGKLLKEDGNGQQGSSPPTPE